MTSLTLLSNLTTNKVGTLKLKPVLIAVCIAYTIALAAYITPIKILFILLGGLSLALTVAVIANGLRKKPSL